MARHKFAYPEAKRSPAKTELAREDFHKIASELEPLVKDHLVADRFTLADIMVAYTLKWASLVGVLDGHPGLEAYMKKQISRPGFPEQLYA